MHVYLCGDDGLLQCRDAPWNGLGTALTERNVDIMGPTPHSLSSPRALPGPPWSPGHPHVPPVVVSPWELALGPSTSTDGTVSSWITAMWSCRINMCTGSIYTNGT